MPGIAPIGQDLAGSTTALQLGRAGRAAVVVDAVCPRDQRSSAEHSVAGCDGLAPRDILARFQGDLAVYLKVSLREGTSRRVQGGQDAFKIGLENAHEIAARRIILANSDILTGLAVISTHLLSAYRALMQRADCCDEVKLIRGGAEGLDDGVLDAAGAC